ncbi:protein crumbs homolog 3a [Pseudorasbora parva]|uniref:protein crumbs homolog 3a n=1 Tax=Pseudorasbora parva TaxID=51549 RepID=UPI00351EB2BB
MIRQVGLLAGSFMLLLLRNVSAQGENTTMPSGFTTQSPSNDSLNIVAIVVPTVVVGLLAILTAVLLFLFCVVRKKRQTEGTYRPSAEEQTGTRSVETPDALKLPKEERLI